MVKLEIKNEKTGLKKVIDVTKYTIEEMCKTFSVYKKAGYSVGLAPIKKQ